MIKCALLVAGEEVRSHVLRTFLGVLSVTIGVAAVVLAISLRDSASSALVHELEQRGGREATYRIEADLLTAADNHRVLSRLAHYGVVASPVLPDDTLSEQWRAGGRAVAPEYADLRRVEVREGRWLQYADGMRLMTVVVVNQRLAGQLTAATGGVIGAVPGTAAVVVGIIEDGLVQPAYYVAAPSTFSHSGAEILFTAPPRAGIDLAVQRDLRLMFGEQSPHLSRIDEMANWRHLLVLVRTVLGAVAFLTLLVGAIGLLNLGLSAVRDRVRDIGIRRSFGARRSDVFAAVLAETVITTVTAAAIGTLLASVILRLAPDLAGLPLSTATVSPEAVVIAVAVALAVGITAGLLPAHRATKVDVISAIRR